VAAICNLISAVGSGFEVAGCDLKLTDSRFYRRLIVMASPTSLVPVEQIEPRILLVRGQRVILDADLAELYGTTTKALNQAAKRNRERFPSDFRVQLTAAEKLEVVTNCDHLAHLKFSRHLPYAFTEHGALMAASILNTPRAIEVSVYVIRAFVRLRELLSTHKELAAKLAELERKVSSHDGAIQSLVAAIRQLMAPPPTPPGRRIGFHVKPER
jgi:ORF6N domain